MYSLLSGENMETRRENSFPDIKGVRVEQSYFSIGKDVLFSS